MVQTGSGDGGAIQSGSACKVKDDGVVQEKDDGEVRSGGYAEHMVKDLGMGMDIPAKRMKRMTMMQFIRKQAVWVLVFQNASAALAGMESDRSWTISFHGRRVPRLDLNRSLAKDLYRRLEDTSVPAGMVPYVVIFQ